MKISKHGAHILLLDYRASVEKQAVGVIYLLGRTFIPFAGLSEGETQARDEYMKKLFETERRKIIINQSGYQYGMFEK